MKFLLPLSILLSLSWTAVSAFETVVANCASGIVKNNDPGLCAATIAFSDINDGSAGDFDSIIINPLVAPVGTTSVLLELSGPGGTSSCTTVVTVVDNEPPSVTCGDELNFSFDVDTNTPIYDIDALVPSASDNCPGVTKDINIAINNGPEGTVVEGTGIATDTSGLIATCIIGGGSAEGNGDPHCKYSKIVLYVMGFVTQLMVLLFSHYMEERTLRVSWATRSRHDE